MKDQTRKTRSGQSYTYLASGRSTRPRMAPLSYMDNRVDPSMKKLPKSLNTQREMFTMKCMKYIPYPTVPGEIRTHAEVMAEPKLRRQGGWLR